VELYKELIDGSERMRIEAELYSEATAEMQMQYKKELDAIPVSEREERFNRIQQHLGDLNVIIDSINQVLRDRGIEPKLYEKHELYKDIQQNSE